MPAWFLLLGLGIAAWLTPPAKPAPAKPLAPSAPAKPPALPPAPDVVPLTLPDMYSIVDLALKYEVEDRVLADLQGRIETLAELDSSWEPYLDKLRARRSPRVTAPPGSLTLTFRR